LPIRCQSAANIRYQTVIYPLPNICAEAEKPGFFFGYVGAGFKPAPTKDMPKKNRVSKFLTPTK
jgi:hypothetical protein